MQTIVAVGGERENSKRCVERVEYNPEEQVTCPARKTEHLQLLIAMLGPPKDRHVRLIPSAALDGRDLKWIRVGDKETKGCHMMAVGRGPAQTTFLALAVKKVVVLYQIDRSEKRHKKVLQTAAIHSGLLDSRTGDAGLAAIISH